MTTNVSTERTHTCDNCGATATAPITRRAAGVSDGRGHSIGPLPRGWERYRADDPFSPLWCSSCIDRLIEAVLVEFRRQAER